MDKEKQEVQLTVGKTVIPADFFTIPDKTYGERHFVREEQGYTEVTKDPVEPIRPHVDRLYVMHEPQSFIDAVNKYGDYKTGVIFYELLHGGSGTITMLFDHDNRKEKIVLPLARSLEFRTFLAGPSKEFSQKEFVKALNAFPECVKVEDFTLFRGMAEKLEVSTTVDVESNVDRDNITLMFKATNNTQATGRLPKKFKLALPFFEGSKNIVEIDVDLEIKTPRTETDEKPKFILANIKHERTEREALQLEIATMQATLKNWQFINGKY